MKSGWAIKKLGEVCEASNGLWKGKKGPFRKIAVLRSTNFTKECQLDLSDVVYIDVESRLLPRKLLREGDIIIEKSGGGPRQPVGRPVYFDKNVGEYSFCNFTSMLRVADSDVLPLYLHRCLYYLYVSGATESLQSYTIGLRNLDFKGYLDLDIPIPPLPEQKRIVAKIDAAFEKIDKLKANAERNLKNAKELFQSALDKAMRPKKGWVEKRLGEVATIRVGPFGSSLHKADYVPKGVPLINPCHMRDSKIDSNITTCVSTAKANELKEYRVCEGDIVFARRGEIGRLAFVSEREEGYLCGTGSLFARFYEKIDSRFLYYAFSTKTFVSTLEKLSTGTTMKSINSSALESMSFAVPSVQEQRQIVKRLDFLAEKVKVLEQHYTRQIADCAEMRQSVLRDAFEGRL